MKNITDNYCFLFWFSFHSRMHFFEFFGGLCQSFVLLVLLIPIPCLAKIDGHECVTRERLERAGKENCDQSVKLNSVVCSSSVFMFLSYLFLQPIA